MQLHGRIIHQRCFMNIDIQTIRCFHHQRRLHSIRIRCYAYCNISGTFHQFPVINLAERGSGIQVFIGIIIARYPECFMIAGQVELGQFIGNNKIFQIGLLWKFITETHAIFKYPEYRYSVRRPGVFWIAGGPSVLHSDCGYLLVSPQTVCQV